MIDDEEGEEEKQAGGGEGGEKEAQVGVRGGGPKATDLGSRNDEQGPDHTGEGIDVEVATTGRAPRKSNDAGKGDGEQSEEGDGPQKELGLAGGEGGIEDEGLEAVTLVGE